MNMDNSPKVYEVRQSPGRGLGAFATKLIPRGTRILAEAPLLFTKINHYLKSDLEDTFNALTTEQKDQFWALHSGHGQDPERWPSQIHSGVSAHEAQRIREQHESRLAPEKSVLSVFMVNCMEMGNGAGVFAEAARFNHSCAPNANFSWNENIGQETIHATRDIEEGEVSLLSPLSQITFHCWPKIEGFLATNSLLHDGTKPTDLTVRKSFSAMLTRLAIRDFVAGTCRVTASLATATFAKSPSPSLRMTIFRRSQKQVRHGATGWWRLKRKAHRA